MMDYPTIKDEIEALKSIFCIPGELELSSLGGDEVVLVLQPFKCSFSLTAVLNETYPVTVPVLDIQSREISRSALENLNAQLKQQAQMLCGDAMIMSLVTWLQDSVNDHLTKCIEAEGESSLHDVSGNDVRTVVLQLDHIRSEQVYFKTLSKWFSDFGLKGTIICHKKWIFLLVSGFKNELQSYMKLHRTNCVDVDSKGRPCKERLLTVLGEVAEPLQLDNLFQVFKLDETASLMEFFKEKQLENIYDKFIQPQVTRNKSNSQH